MTSKEIRILESAKEFFFRYGFKKTNVEEIAQAAGVGKGTIYNYFQSKEDLFVRCGQWHSEQTGRELEAEIGREKGAEKKLFKHVLINLRNLAKEIRRYAMPNHVLEEIIQVAENLAIKNEEHVQIIATYLKEGVREGTFKSSDLMKRASLITRINRQFFYRWCVMDPEEAESEIRDIYEMIFDGLRK
ncbi:MAG: TetR/AcrR family transcriptional regulator [Proteobacteria bacterium]|nr:TetR/AcrR family transcriptional regulator [Pseudomonadota bacterium]